MSHDLNKLSSFDFWGAIDYVAGRERFKGARRFGLHPSSASVVANEDGFRYVVGGCHRAAAYQNLSIPPSNPLTTKSKYIFAFGDLTESMIRDFAKETGLFEANSVKFYYPRYKISGEIDLVMKTAPDKDEFIITEIKSSYGYYTKKELSKGVPKDANFVQILTYLWAAIDDPNTFTYADKVIGGKLVYFLRDSMDRFQFNITIEEDEKGQHWPVINGKRDNRFTIEDMMHRYDVLLSHMMNIYNEIAEMQPKERTIDNLLKLRSLPERDYTRKYSDQEIEMLYKRGDISKTAYDAWKKHPDNLIKRPGHWMCGYCAWRDICWNKDAIDNHLKEGR